MEASLEAIGQVLLKTKICERPQEFFCGHGREGTAGHRKGWTRGEGGGPRLAWITWRGTSFPGPGPRGRLATFSVTSSTRRSSTLPRFCSTIHPRIGEAAYCAIVLDLCEGRTLRIFICMESGHWIGSQSRRRRRCWHPCDVSASFPQISRILHGDGCMFGGSRISPHSSKPTP